MYRRPLRLIIFILLFILLYTIAISCALQGEETEMPHGQRDWSNIGATEVVHGTADMAELAARLGSPDVFNREGNVLYMETFEQGSATWGKTLGGTNAAIVTSPTEYRTGGYSLQLNSGTGSLHYALAAQVFPYPELSKFGVELSCSFDTNVTLLDPEFWVYDGDTLYVYGLRYDPVNKLVQKRTGTTTWKPIIEDVALNPSTGHWNLFKFVCDLSTGYFSRLIINEIEYDISDEQAFSAPVEDYARLNFRFTVRGSSTQAGIAYLDDVIITRAEP